MALVICPECTTEISDKAPACPKCGAPVARVQAPAMKAAAAPDPSIETVVWAGSPAGISNMKAHIFAVLLCLTLIGIPIAIIILIVAHIARKNTKYEITNQRVKISKGIVTRSTLEVELFRIKETALDEPWLYRMNGVGNVLILSSEPMMPAVRLIAVPKARELREQLRAMALSTRRGPGRMVTELETI